MSRTTTLLRPARDWSYGTTMTCVEKTRSVVLDVYRYERPRVRVRAVKGADVHVRHRGQQSWFRWRVREGVQGCGSDHVDCKAVFECGWGVASLGIGHAGLRAPGRERGSGAVITPRRQRPEGTPPPGCQVSKVRRWCRTVRVPVPAP